MKRGYLYVAHDNGMLDYGTMTFCSALSLKKHTEYPIVLVSDESTWDSLLGKYPQAESLFQETILVKKPETDQKRRYKKITDSQAAPYYNQTRSEVFSLTPFDETLLIDSDMVVLDNQYDLVWGSYNDVMVNTGISRLIGNYDDSHIVKRLSESTIPILWATVTYFKKNERVKQFFDLVSYVRENFRYFGNLYGFEPKLYRNDYAFSIASHIMSGFIYGSDNFVKSLPVESTMFAWDGDFLLDVGEDHLLFSVDNMLVKTYTSTHVMNKFTFLKHKDKMIEVFS